MQIIVIESGFIYVGKCEKLDHPILGNCLVVKKAKNIRNWGTTKGLGQLANIGATKNTILDYTGTVTVPVGKVLHLVDMEIDAQKTII